MKKRKLVPGREKTAAHSKYDPDYCGQLIDHMAKGLSIESFAGEIGVTQKTIYNWKETYPEFEDAASIGHCKSLLFYERAGANLALTGQGNATSIVFNLKNRDPRLWRDRTEVDNTHNVKIQRIERVIIDPKT